MQKKKSWLADLTPLSARRGAARQILLFEVNEYTYLGMVTKI